jgi:diadenosine tetraphosphate (Ap4A) HIT family hydrolase
MAESKTLFQKIIDREVPAEFVFEDEKCVVPEGYEEQFNSLPSEYSHLYMAK